MNRSRKSRRRSGIFCAGIWDSSVAEMAAGGQAADSIASRSGVPRIPGSRSKNIGIAHWINDDFPGAARWTGAARGADRFRPARALHADMEVDDVSRPRHHPVGDALDAAGSRWRKVIALPHRKTRRPLSRTASNTSESTSISSPHGRSINLRWTNEQITMNFLQFGQRIWMSEHI